MIQHVPVHVLEAKYGLVLQQESRLTCEQLLGAYGVLRQVLIDEQKAVLEIPQPASFFKKKTCTFFWHFTLVVRRPLDGRLSTTEKVVSKEKVQICLIWMNGPVLQVQPIPF